MKLPDSIATWAGAILICLVLLFAIVSFQAWIFMLLWNWLIGGVLGYTLLTFWQSMGAIVLLNLIGGFFKGTSHIK